MKSVNKILSSIVALFLLSAAIVSAAACGSRNAYSLSLANRAVYEDVKFGAASVDISIEDFNALGFKLGDSCTVKFSNGYELEDVPYFNGYYVKNGMPVIVAYPSAENISITLNNVGIWNTARLDENCTVDVTVTASGKYLSTQEALGQAYSLVREEYSCDEEFANYRAVVGGNLKENVIFRGASPVDNSRNRAAYTDALIKNDKINCIIDLADSEEDMQKYFAEEGFSSTYAKGLYEGGNTKALSMSSSYASDAYKKKVAEGFKFMLEKDGPYYIHCMEGKDRTGFVCALVSALAGASYEEMRADYMKTYENYYKITEEKTPAKYNAVVSLYFDSFMECLYGTDDINVLKTANYVDSAKKYLKDGGMTEGEIDLWLEKLTKK